LKEMEVLNAQLAGLKQQAMASMGNIDRDTARSMQLGCELRDDVHVNQQKFGEIASIISEFSICVRLLCSAHSYRTLADSPRLHCRTRTLVLHYTTPLGCKVIESLGRES